MGRESGKEGGEAMPRTAGKDEHITRRLGVVGDPSNGTTGVEKKPQRRNNKTK